MIDRTNYIGIFIFASRNVLPNCLAGYCQTICMKKSFFIQLIHNRIDSACLIKVFDICMACRSKMTKVRRLLTDSVRKINLKIHSYLMCDCRKMKHTVCRTSKSHIDCKSVQNRIFRHNISRSDIVSHKLHNLHSRMFCKLKSRRIYRGNRSVSTKSHSQCFCQTIHAIGCIHSGTRTARRTCFIFKFINFFIVHFACRIRSDRFKHA